jgi:hypothetical protein
VEVPRGHRRKLRHQEEGGHRGVRNARLPNRASRLLRVHYRGYVTEGEGEGEGHPLHSPLLSSCER